MKLQVLVLCFGIIIFGCKSSLNPVKITKEGIFFDDRVINQFSISQFKDDSKSLSDIRPNNHTEVMRYCCELKAGGKGNNKVLFKDDNSMYRWRLCLLDTSNVKHNGVNPTAFTDSSKVLEEINKFKEHVGKEIILPFTIEKGYVYQLFGIPDIEGSYYFRIKADGELIVQFFDNGPW